MVGLNTNSPMKNPVLRWVDQRLPIFTLMTQEYSRFPTPKNFNYLWNFGAIAMVMLVIMIATGVVVSMGYTANAHLAFDSIQRYKRDVNYGWLLQSIHANGASMFFMAVYIHIFRGMYYGSYKHPRELLWILGVVIFLLMMATAFMGYVLPWGQMSFWGATVITNLFSALPLVGKSIVTFLWGGFSVDNPTLNRFFSLHFLLPFVICAVVFLHVWALHITGSNNPLGIDPKGPQDTVPFHPYYTIKDSFGITVFLIIYAIIVFYAPDYLGHPDNYIPADPMVTPAHIVPEWYFLPFYAILRSWTFNIGIPFTGITLIEAKLVGVILMFGAIAMLFALPWLDTSPVRSSRFRPTYKIFFWLLLFDGFFLGFCGSSPADGNLTFFGHDLFIPTPLASLLGMLYYYFFFLILSPWLGKVEKTLPLPYSISQPVFAENA